MAGALFRIDGGQPQAPFIGPLLPLFTLNQANMVLTTDQPFVATFGFDQYVLRAVRLLNSSAVITLAAGGIYSAAAKAGVIVFSAAATTWVGGQAVNSGGDEKAVNNTGAGLFTQLAATAAKQAANAAFAPGLFSTAVTPILSLTTANGVACLADLIIYGHAVTLQ